MNGFANHGLDEDAFGEKRGNIVQAFDAFRKFPWVSCAFDSLSMDNWICLVASNLGRP